MYAAFTNRKISFGQYININVFIVELSYKVATGCVYYITILTD